MLQRWHRAGERIYAVSRAPRSKGYSFRMKMLSAPLFPSAARFLTGLGTRALRRNTDPARHLDDLFESDGAFVRSIDFRCRIGTCLQLGNAVILPGLVAKCRGGWFRRRGSVLLSRRQPSNRAFFLLDGDVDICLECELNSECAQCFP